MKRVIKSIVVLLLILGGLYIIVVQPVFQTQPANIAVRVTPNALQDHVKMLSETNPARKGDINLNITASYIKRQLERSQGKFGKVSETEFQVDGKTFRNVSLLLGDGSKPRIVVGAHYDSFEGFPGADDNASGVAVLLEVSKLLTDRDNKNDIELIAYSQEEPPSFGSENMGSYLHAKQLEDNKIPVILMLSLEMLGYFSDDNGSQGYPAPGMNLIYPEKGNFIALISDLHSMLKLRRAKRHMQSAIDFPALSMSVPGFLFNADWSDHRWFWQKGFAAIMITDTAFYRNQAYHTENDTMERLNFEKMAKVADGVHQIIIAFDD